MWSVIIGSLTAVAIGGCIYLYTRFQRFAIIRRLAGEKMVIRRLLALIPILGFAVYYPFNQMRAIAMVLHVVVFWLLGDLTGWIINRKRKVEKRDKNSLRPYYTGLFVLVFSTAYLFMAWYLVSHVWRTEYDLKTDKDPGQDTLKAVLISDSHIGATFDGEGFAEHLKEMQNENPDILVIVGDYVDDDTKKEDMIRSCQALGEFNTKYGIYYVFGNHDKGYYNFRDFTYADLITELKENGVVVLEDEATLINDSFYVIGRMDKREAERKSVSELVTGLDHEKYMIMLDHQPADYDAQAAAGVDLVLSGHTHGGQIFPFNYVGEWIGTYDRTYGYEKRNGTDFVVSSGIADWSLAFKTGTKSEYVVISISRE